MYWSNIWSYIWPFYMITSNSHEPMIFHTRIIKLQLLNCVRAVAVVQSPFHVRFFVAAGTAACQASLSLTISWSLPKVMSIASVMPSSHLILWCPLLLLPSIFPSIRDFSMSQLFASGDQNNGASASATVLPVSIQSWFPLKLIGLIPLLFKGLCHL